MVYPSKPSKSQDPRFLADEWATALFHDRFMDFCLLDEQFQGFGLDVAARACDDKTISGIVGACGFVSGLV